MGLNDIPFLPFQLSPAGVDLGNVIVTPTGGLIQYVRATGPLDYDPPALTGRILPSINTALAYCRAGAGDTIYVLPGHTESVSTAAFFSNLVAGTRIIGLGDEQNRPALTWTAAGSTWLLNKANVVVENMRLLLAPSSGSVTVAAPITVSAAGVTIRRCYIDVGSSALRFATAGITVAAGADDFAFLGNIGFGAPAATPTDFLVISGAVARPKIIGNDIQASTSAAAHGVLAVTTAATNVEVKQNFFANYVAASTVAAQFVTGTTGVVSDNYAQTVNASAATAITIAAAGPSSFNNFICQAGKQPIPATTAAGAST